MLQYKDAKTPKAWKELQDQKLAERKKLEERRKMMKKLPR